MNKMTPISDNAFAVISYCPEAKKTYGISVDPIAKMRFRFVWAFKIGAEQAHREGYDSKTVTGSVELDNSFPGCPYCKSKQFLFCTCGAVMCWHGQSVVTCPKCGLTGEVSTVTNVNLKGGGF